VKLSADARCFGRAVGSLSFLFEAKLWLTYNSSAMLKIALNGFRAGTLGVSVKTIQSVLSLASSGYWEIVEHAMWMRIDVVL